MSQESVFMFIYPNGHLKGMECGRQGSDLDSGLTAVNEGQKNPGTIPGF